MAGDDDNSTFYLNLDSGDFIVNANQALTAIKGIGASENLSGLIEGLETAMPVVAALGAAFFAIKGTLEAVFDAEQIKQTQQQFEILSTQSGVYSDKLKEGLEKSSQGWVDETNLMQMASQAMVQLQTGADKLPEIMDLARKSTIVMGGDIKDNFNMIVQAIASGRTQTLKMHGMVVDMATAYRDYAKSIGVSANALSEAGKQEAMMEAVLKVGKQQFANVSDAAREGIDTWTQFKATMVDVGDAIKIAFDKIAGPTVIKELHLLSDAAKGVSSWFAGQFGSGLEKAKAKTQDLANTALDLTVRIGDLEKKAKTSSFTPNDGQLLARYKTQLADVNSELEKTNQIQKQLTDQEQKKVAIQHAAADAAKKSSATDPAKQAQEEAKAKKDIAALDAQLTAAKIQDMDSVVEASKLYQQQLDQEGQKIKAQIAEVKAAEAAGTITHKNASAEIAKLNHIKDLKMEKDDAALEKMQEQALDNYKAHAETVFQGVGRAFQEMSLKNKHAMQDFGAFGDKVSNSFGTHMTTAFKEIGSGAKSASDAMEDAMLGMIAEVAENYGQMMMLASIFPPNPPVFAAGAALIMLGGLLGSMGSGTSSGALTAGSPDTGISGSPGSLNNPANPTGGTSLASQTNGPGQVNLIIQGHMFGTDSTQRWLVDQIRGAADATDFKVQSVGGGL